MRHQKTKRGEADDETSASSFLSCSLASLLPSLSLSQPPFAPGSARRQATSTCTQAADQWIEGHTLQDTEAAASELTQSGRRE